MSSSDVEYVVESLMPTTGDMLDEVVTDEAHLEHAASKTEESRSVSKKLKECAVPLGEELWVRNHASPADLEATEVFIKIVGSDKYQSFLHDKKSQKAQVWEDIYREMKKRGYNIAKNRKEGGPKCSQKWRNLERSYIQYVGYVQTAESEKKMKRPPVHYELLCEVFKDDHNADIVVQKKSVVAEREHKSRSLTSSSYTRKSSIKRQAQEQAPAPRVAPPRWKKGETLWVKRNPSTEDLEATDTFINIVGSIKYQALLNDRKTRKSEVWQEVYEEMVELGYFVADNKVDGGIKCSQKWRNLVRAYIQYVMYEQTAKTDNKRKKKPPAQYDLLHAVLNDKLDIIYPQYMTSSPDVQELELERPPSSTSSYDEEKCSPNLKSQLPASDTTRQSKDNDYIIVSLSPDVNKMLVMTDGNTDLEQHADSEASDSGYTPVKQSSDELLWATNHATPTDLEATEAFIKIVGSNRYQPVLNNRNTRKSHVWEEVYKEMIKLGYYIAENAKEGGIKCSQKWRNLERSYIQFVGHTKTVGAENRKRISKYKKPPMHYELLHAVFKGRNDANYTEVRAPCAAVYEGEHKPSTSSSDTHNRTSERFPPLSSVSNISMSQATPQDILHFVVSEAQKQEKQFSKLCEILNKQIEEKKRLTDAIIAFLSRTTEHRKRKASEIDSE